MADAWTPSDLDRIGRAEEIELASYRVDGTLRPYVTMWVIAADDQLCVRSAGGPDRPWYRNARTAGRGRLRVVHGEHDVTFTSPSPDTQQAIDAAYHAKYDRYGPRIVGSVVGPAAHAVTIRLEPTGDTR